MASTTITATMALPNEGFLQMLNEPYTREECFVPALTNQCHASNLCFVDNGDLLCSWFGGSQEGKPDICIYLSRLRKSSKTWSKPVQMTFDGTRSEQNPIIFQTPGGDIWLLYTSQLAGNQDSAVVKRRISKDGGSTWDDPIVLFNEQGTFIRQPLVILENGTWVIPIFKCRTEPGTRWVGNDDVSCVRASIDQGKTWTETEVPNSFGAVHMQIQQLKDKSYLGLFRSRWADNIYLSTSTDGLNWQEPRATSLPNPNSGICFDVLPSGRIIVIYNHSSKANATGRREGLYDDIGEADDQRKNQSRKHAGKEAFWGAPRAPLCIGWSDDNGKSWLRRTLQDGDGYCMTNNSERKENRELSYPSIAIGKDGTIHVAFTFWRQKIKYLRLNEDVFARVDE